MTNETLVTAARRVLYDADLEDYYDMKDSDGRFISKKALIGLRDALAAGRETPAPPSEPQIIDSLVEALFARGLKSTSGVPLFFDKFNMRLEIEKVLHAQSSASAPAGEKP